MTMLVYVASSYDNAPFVRDVVHEKLIQLGIQPTSRWAERAFEPEDFSKMTPSTLLQAARENDSDLRGSDVVFLCDPKGLGKETYCEARVAIEWRKPVIWLGSKMLSMWREGVVRVESIEDAYSLLRTMTHHHARGVRGQLLATVRSAE